MGRRCGWRLAVLAGMLAAAGGVMPNQVIAATSLIDQSAESALPMQDDSQAGDAAVQPVDGSAPVVATTNPAESSGVHWGVQWGVMVLGVATVMLFFWRGWQRLNHAPRQPRAFEPEIGLGLVLVMFVLGKVGVMAAQSMAGITLPADGSALDVPQMSKMTLGLYAGQAIVLIVYLWMRNRAAPPRPESRWPQPMAAAMAVLVLPFVLAVVFTIGALAGWLLGAPDDVIAHDTLRVLVDSPWSGWTMLLAVVVVVGPAIFEETMYRGLLQRSIVNAGLSRWLAIGASSVVFTLLHVGAVAPHALVSLLVLSLTMGWLYERTGRLTAPVVLHALFNAANLALAKII